jgi:hypothetical protein
MANNNLTFNVLNETPNWVTIPEAVDIASKLTKVTITPSSIYRNALSGKISLSIYFQSSYILRKVRLSGYKIKLCPTKNSLIDRLCLLEKNCFLKGRNLTISTEGECFFSTHRIIDTPLIGYEYVLVQRLLAHALNIPFPINGANNINYGISVNILGEVFQIFEKTTWNERIKQQLTHFPENTFLEIVKNISSEMKNIYCQEYYFPLHDLPRDACFVIRYAELEKLMHILVNNKATSSSSTRISTPLSRLFWLACKHNETISPLIRQPYKLLSIFEQWASDEGITDRLSGDTLKTALERGSPKSVSTQY